MRSSRRRRAVAAIALIAAAVLAGGAAGWLAWGHAARGARRGEDAAPPLAIASAADPLEARAGARAAAPALAAAFDAFLAAVPARRLAAAPKASRVPSPREVLDAARRAGKRADPVDLRLALEAAIGARPDGAREAAALLVGDRGATDGRLLFQLALALAPRLDAAATALLLEGLRTAPAEARPHVALALRGAPASEVTGALVALYCGDEDVPSRAAAAFVLADRGERLSEEERARAQGRALADLDSADPALVRAAADVLGAAPLRPEERARLLESVREGQSERRLAVLRALATGGAPPEEVILALEAAARDPAVGDAMRAGASAGPARGGGDR